MDLELVRLMDALSVLTFFPVSSCPWDAWCLCSPNKQSHMYLHTQGCRQRLLHLAAVPRPASGYLCSKGTLGVSTEIEDSVTDRSLGVSAVQSHFATACEMVPRLKV